MSGGSFNYLYCQEPYSYEDLESMAQELRRRGMYDAADATRELMPKRADELLSQLWMAVEWHVSNDWSEAEVARAFVTWEKAQRVEDDVAVS